MDLKKKELQKLINNEHGINYHRNINLSGYTVYRKDSFISFHFVDVNGIKTVVIDYIYIVNKTDLVKLISFCVHFFDGNGVKFIYYREHKRDSNVVQKFFTTIGFDVHEQHRNGVWKHEWTSTNGYDENEIVEAYV